MLVLTVSCNLTRRPSISLSSYSRTSSEIAVKFSAAVVSTYRTPPGLIHLKKLSNASLMTCFPIQVRRPIKSLLIHWTAQESNTARSDLLEQCQKFLSQDKYRRAITMYKEDCSKHFSGTIEDAKYAAHRIFDHINVLFVLPSVKHLKESLRRGGFSPGLVNLVDQLSFEWSKLAIIALKFEATLDRSAIGRMNDTFDTLSKLTEQFWVAVEHDGGRRNA
jgi:hypothetical protein